MEADVSTSSPKTSKGMLMASSERWASWSMDSWSDSPGSRMANSSPPTRATVSWRRTVSTSRWLTCLIRSSPAACPRVSLTVLK